MRHVALFRAQDFGHRPAIEMTIVIANPLPDAPPVESRGLFVADAAALADALWSSLPGGTIDALLGEMLARRASLLRAPMPTANEEVR